MAFVNGPQMMRDIANMCHERFGTTIVYSPGWETRGNGQSWPAGGPKGFVDHHTAGGNNIYLDQNLISGVPGLSGPLCNFAGLYDGDLALVAAYPANHAGASGGWDTAPLPRTGMFNREVLGIEMQYRGTEPMSPEQYQTLLAVNFCAAEVLGWEKDYRRIKNHQGTSIQGKWDMGRGNGVTYDINQIRRDIAAKGGTAANDDKTWDRVLTQMMGTSA
ncbi:lysin A, N-acetyl-beta-D-muramidase domain [Gordonia phage Jumbo]|uniref:Lysin A, N-acetyl-beta-D-muramidase domain n=1 Tax=Gordonia phage Jumbo TaxID=1887650 RepID=A0A1B3B0M4_9CAUD|nr:endolysin [Gordonia phage Jumbo]AOE44541.1 lysin A, N-acetyl-beta-D-muramidase domain [Gordonia phage Jumbo]